MREITVEELIAHAAHAVAEGKLTDEEAQEMMRIAAKERYARHRQKAEFGPTPQEGETFQALWRRIRPAI